MRISVLSLVIGCLMSSCQVYQAQFDCCPGRGVPCASLTEIEKLIVETEEGPDLFLGNPKTDSYWKQDATKYIHTSNGRIWIEQKITQEGCECGHYLYLSEQAKADSCNPY